jgi:hypothetical protein
LTFTYALSTTSTGAFYQVAGEKELDVSAGRPVQPLKSYNVHQLNTIAHGVLMLGGSFTDVPDFDPVVSRIVTDQVNIPEPAYPTLEWYPAEVGSINRFLAIDGQSRERLVVVPGQYRAASSTAPTGTERLYTSLDFVVYRAPFAATDFIAPNIWQTDAVSTTTRLIFRVRANDDSGSIARVVMLYRGASSNQWLSVDLAYDPISGQAVGSAPAIQGPIEYFPQAVDPDGNVSLALDHGAPFTQVAIGQSVYLPLIRR